MSAAPEAQVIGERLPANPADALAVNAPGDVPPDPDAAVDPSTPLFRIRPFRLLFITRVASTTGTQMLAVVAGWHVYEVTSSALHLGLIGLAQVLPPLLLMLVAGQVADHFNRRTILRLSYAIAFCSTLGLVLTALSPMPYLPALYVLLFINATARIFEQPVMQALVPVMAPRAVLNRAIAAHVSARHLSVLVGPALGGVLYVFGPAVDYGVCAAMFMAAQIATLFMSDTPPARGRPEVSWETIVAGFRFIGRCQPVLGAILLDFIATLFGSVNALLPIYARDILDTGAWGAGVLRSATAFGALIAAVALSRFPVQRNGGLWMFGGYVIDAAAVIVFGFSTNLFLSIGALIVIGIGEMISAVVRQTILLVSTPDEMRGRVSAVNALFYGSAGQFGSFRAGIMAAGIGAVGSVVVGGLTMVAAVALSAWLMPSLRRVDRPDEAQPH